MNPAPSPSHCRSCDAVLRADAAVCDACGMPVPGVPDPAQTQLFTDGPDPNLPGFIARALHPRTSPRWRLVALALALLLALQLVWSERERLAQDARWRPWLIGVCDVAGCRLPPWRDPTQFAIVTRDVRPHPDADDTLQISATFRNTAPFAQAWPQLELRLLDLNGQVTGARRFRPAEYLGAAPAAATLAPGQSANARIDVLDPGRTTLSFEFAFR